MIRAARHLAECPALAARTFGSADQLARLGNCIRAICEKAGDLRWSFPDLEPEDRVTWDSETSWLLATMSWWTTDAWCCEWITAEVEAIRAKLVERIERASGWTTCALCGTALETHEIETLVTIECPACDRVASMRERQVLTTSEAAEALGVSASAIRLYVSRGQLHRAGRRGRQALVAVPDGLDWARAKLGLPTRAGGDGKPI